MIDNEKLIEKAAKEIIEADDTFEWDGVEDANAYANNWSHALARAALAVFEKAHTPTDDEREAMAEAAYPSRPFHETGVTPWPQSFRDAFLSGWDARNRQGEPSDAQALLSIRDDIVRNGGRADAAVLAGLEALVLRAAGRVR